MVLPCLQPRAPRFASHLASARVLRRSLRRSGHSSWQRLRRKGELMGVNYVTCGSNGDFMGFSSQVLLDFMGFDSGSWDLANNI